MVQDLAPAGKGVQGFSSAADGRGIVGYTTGYRGRAVYGVSSSSSQIDRTYGGYFEATGEYATGVYGEAIGHTWDRNYWKSK